MISLSCVVFLDRNLGKIKEKKLSCFAASQLLYTVDLEIRICFCSNTSGVLGVVVISYIQRLVVISARSRVVKPLHLNEMNCFRGRNN